MQNQLNKGEDPNDLESISSEGSDSNPSADNFDEEDLKSHFYPSTKPKNQVTRLRLLECNPHCC